MTQSAINHQPSARGKVWKYGDAINTDLLFPGRHTYTARGEKEIAEHALEDLDPRFAKEVKKGDVIVAGKNFGNGSSREQAVTCLTYNGVAAVVAKSFARIFFRNGLNQGFPLITCPEVVDAAKEGDEIQIDLKRSVVILNGKDYPFPPFSPSAVEMLELGGLIPQIRKKLGITSTEEVKVSSGE
jgi:3-isopropylmalate/(R)-2-methylmalate dehydratase small subunit